MSKNKLKLSEVDSKGYGKIPKMPMKDKDLAIEAKGIYAYLCSYAGSGDTAFPSVSLICDDLDISENRFYKYRKQLTNKGYITITKERKDGKWQNNVYKIEPYLQNSSMDNSSTQNSSKGNKGTNNNSTNNNSINNNNSNTSSQNKDSDDKVKFDKDSKPYKAAMYLKKKIKSNIPNQPTPKDSPKAMEEWSLAMDRLHRLGTVGGDSGYSWDEIKEIIDWCQEDDFWYKNILSASKLRKQAVKLETRMKEDKSYMLNQPEEEIDYYADLN